MTDRLPLPSPMDYCYEWDGPYGTRKFSAALHNGAPPSRSVPIYTADQMRQYAEDANAALREQVRVLRAALDVAWARMDTAREILTEGNPRQNCNWGLLDTSIARAALEASK